MRSWREKAAGSVVLVALLGMFFVSAPVSANSSGVTVSIDAPAAVAPGSDFVARVNISSVTDFDACNYDVTYNSAVLQVIETEGGTSGVTAGLINGTAIPADMCGFIPPGTPGKIRVIQNVPGVAGVSGAGYLA